MFRNPVLCDMRPFQLIDIILISEDAKLAATPLPSPMTFAAAMPTSTIAVRLRD
jgi:hypothetical protein